MDKLEPDDTPLVIDAMFAMTINTYAMVMKDNLVEPDRDLFTQRFIKQGIDPDRAKRVSRIIVDSIVESIKNIKDGLRGE